MVMSTKEQETFETALVTPASLDTIKAGLSKIDVRQVLRTLYVILTISWPGSPSAYATVGYQGPELQLSPINRRSAATSRTRTRSCSSWSRAWAPTSATGWSSA
jgi:hypothetical protein